MIKTTYLIFWPLTFLDFLFRFGIAIVFSSNKNKIITSKRLLWLQIVFLRRSFSISLWRVLLIHSFFSFPDKLISKFSSNWNSLAKWIIYWNSLWYFRHESKREIWIIPDPNNNKLVSHQRFKYCLIIWKYRTLKFYSNNFLNLRKWNCKI